MMSQKQLKKTRTFLLKKSPSMEHPLSATVTAAANDQNYCTSAIFVTKKSPPVEFPTSPQHIFGEEILHFSHPQHPLSQVDLADLFTCAGCKEYGSGKRFVCQQCDFQLHDFCAFAPPALKAHPLHSQHPILFHSRPVKGGISKSKCDVCGKSTKGYTFICSACGFQMHPCCAMLSTEIDYSAHPHSHRTLKLLPAATSTPATSSNGDVSAGFVCGECKKKRSGRVYQCTVCDYYLHAVCAKSRVNGLQANGIKGPQKPSMLGIAARLASQVVKEFVGGLIEGLGESMGEVLGQNIGKGRSSSRTRLQ